MDKEHRTALSALDGWIDVCRTGTWRDMKGREVKIDEASLDRVVEHYATADPAPVVVGHPKTNAPAYGWVDTVRRTGDRLQVKLRDLDDDFRATVEANRYAGRSIALGDDGGLVHLGFLGGRAPAVSGLAPTQFSSEPESVIALSAAELAGPATTEWGWRVVARTFRSLRDWLIERDGTEAADRVIADWEIEAIRDAAEAHDDDATGRFAAPAGDPARTSEHPSQTPAHTDTRKQTRTQTKEIEVMPNDQDKPDRAPGAPSPDSPSAAIAQPGDAVMKAKAQDDATIAEQQAALAAERKALAAERARLDARLDEADARHRLASADQALEGHVKAGRILPAERPRLAALMAHLASGSKDADRTAGADGEATTLCFAGPDGTETQEQPEAALEAFLSALPVRVHYGVVAGSDTTPAAAQAGDPTVVEKAHALMAADATGTLTIDRAVRRVRAEMGEPNHA